MQPLKTRVTFERTNSARPDNETAFLISENDYCDMTEQNVTLNKERRTTVVKSTINNDTQRKNKTNKHASTFHALQC